MYLGLDIGGTNLKVGIMNDKNELVQQIHQSTNAAKGLDYLLNLIKRVINTSITKFPMIKAIGVGIPGVVQPDGTVRFSPNLPEWVDVPFGKFLGNVFSLPIIVDNDANTAAYAEMLIGSGKDLNNFIYVTLGTGVGGSIVLDRKIYRGETNGAGEFGYIIIDNIEPTVAPDKAYRIGTVESALGKNNVTEFSKRYIKSFPNSQMHKFEKPDPYFISQAVTDGDEAAISIFKIMGRNLGIGLVSAMNLLDIRVAIIGGGLSLADPFFLEYTEKFVKERALPHIAANARVIRAEFTKDAGVIGAALLAKSLVK